MSERSKEMRVILRNIRKRYGLTYTTTGSGHYRIVTDDGQTVIIPKTPSDHRSILDVHKKLRHAGISVK